MPSMSPSCLDYSYPVDLDRIATDVARRGIDIAPTRQTWECLACCLATHAGEQGRDAFHKMAAVWPDYSRHDSEQCYNRALRQSGRQVGIGYLAKALKRHGLDIGNARYRKPGRRLTHMKTNKTNKTNKTKTMKKIEINTMQRTLANGLELTGRNQLIDLLCRRFPQTRVMAAVQRYRIGFNSNLTGNQGDALIFWQVDENGNIVNAKKIFYRFDGHRDAKVPPIVMFPDNPQCLFGLHLLKETPADVPVGIVESEKSALVMSLIKPEILWMACGSMNNFNENFLRPLRHRFIIGFPDVDYRRDKFSLCSISCALWQQTAKVLRKKSWRVVIDTHLEETATTSQRLDKIDVADLALEQAKIENINRLKKQQP